jgi:hypothetical protein
MLGVFPVLAWTHKLDDGWEARVEAKTRDGAVVGAAESECLRSERKWANREDYAVRSMAATRATSKALRQPLGFVMTLAGFEATPAEEIPADERPKSPVEGAEPSREQLEESRCWSERSNGSTRRRTGRRGAVRLPASRRGISPAPAPLI